MTAILAGCGETTERESSAAAARTVKDLDGYRCASDETKYGRCPNNLYFGKTMAQAQAAKKAKAIKVREERAAAARAAKAEAAAAAAAEAERLAEEQAALEAANAWIPEGWNQYDETTYWQWTDDCDGSYTGCHGMDVITRDGCSGLYVELQLLDSAGNAVGFTNDTLGSLDPGQVAKLDFSIYEDRAASAKLAEINCY